MLWPFRWHSYRKISHRIRQIHVYIYGIALKLDRRLDSIAVEATVKFQSDAIV